MSNPKLSPAQLRFLEAAYRFGEQYPGSYFSWWTFGRVLATCRALQRLGLINSLESVGFVYYVTHKGRELIERHIAKREQIGAANGR